ncbi:SDR family oxidoreductase [Maricaulis sp. CAU 1757]
MRIFIIGATGGVGQRLCPKLIAAGHDVIGLHRKPEQAATLKQWGVTPASGDLTKLSETELGGLMSGCDAVIFSAGAGGGPKDKTTAIDGDGAIKAMSAAENHGVDRFYLVSVIMDAGRDREPDEQFEHYMKEKRRADNALAASKLDWVILRPGTLQDEAGDGRIRAGRAIDYGDTARGHVAATLAALVETPALSQEIIELTDGDTPVQEAITGLVRV